MHSDSWGRALLWAVMLSLTVSACHLSSEKIEIEKADKAVETKDFSTALEHYDNVINRHANSPFAVEAAEQAGKIAFYETKEFQRAIGYYKHVVLNSKSAELRKQSQEKIAELNYEHLQNYKQAIIEYNKLLDLAPDKAASLGFRLNLARSYFYLKNFYQSLVEVDEILGRGYDAKELFDVHELKANVLLQSKRLDEAIKELQSLSEIYPERSKERQIGMVLAVCYEEKKDFAKAIETLESIKESYPSKEFINGRIKTLRERQSYLPGARGLKK